MPYEENIKVPRFNEENGFYTTKKRSKIMSKIRGKGSKPEKQLRQLLWQAGLRYRKNVKTLPGTPDIVLRKHKLVIFVDGEFWHGHNWKQQKQRIGRNRNFWIPKIERNMQRDRQVTEQLREMGFTVIRFWDKQVKKEPGTCLKVVLDYVNRTELGLPIK